MQRSVPGTLAALLLAGVGLAGQSQDFNDRPGAGPMIAMPAQSNSHLDEGALRNTGEVAVTAPAAPSGTAPSDSLDPFIVHHATVHVVDYGTSGDLARWRGGRQSICPLTEGLSPEIDAFMTARLRAVAEYVGAPVESNPNCKTNVQLLFTDDPKPRMEEVRKWATSYFRERYTGGTKNLIAYKGDHPVQGWYLLTRGGAIVLNTDLNLLGIDVWPLWPQITQRYERSGRMDGIGIGLVILVADKAQAASLGAPTIVDYLTMLVLSVAQSPDHCDALPSILDLTATDCGARKPPSTITAADLAFLRALYNRNTGLGPSLTRADIVGSMTRQFNGSAHP